MVINTNAAGARPRRERPRARFVLGGFALGALFTSFATPGCELITGIHERDIYDAGADAPSCPTNMGDCDGNPANGCEADLTANPKNCGRCAHDCQAGACSSGTCQPFVMSKGQPGPIALAVSDAGIFWANAGGNVSKLPLAGGNVEPIAPVPGGQVQSIGLALTSTSVFWTVNTMTATMGTVKRAGLDGFGVADLFSGEQTVGGIAADETTLYWAESYGDKVHSGSPGGGAPVVLATLPVPSTPYGVAVDKDSVYFTAIDARSVSSVPIGGGKRTTLATQQDAPWAIALGDAYVYWTNIQKTGFTDGHVMMVAKTTGELPVTLVTGQKAPDGITVDAAALYWTTAGHDPGGSGVPAGTVMKLPLTGGKPVDGATPITLAADQDGPTAVVVHGGVLYWATGSGGQIVAMVQ